MGVFTEEWLTGPSKTEFYTRTYGPSNPRAVILFIHGLASHVGRYTELYQPITQHGIAVFAFDQRGYGETARGKEVKSGKTPSSYEKTTWKDQMRDIAWAVGHVQKRFENKPLFLMGYSVGGAAVLSFATQNTMSPHRYAVSSLHGVIAISPVIQQTKPVPNLTRWIGSKVSLLIPHIPIPLPTVPEDLSQDPEYNKAWSEDKLVKKVCPLKSLMDVLRNGDALLKSSYKNWPKSLPLLIAHGTKDKIASYKASQEFFDKVSSSDKRISPFQDKYHALMIEDGEKLANEIAQIINTNNTPLSHRQLPERSNTATPQHPFDTGVTKANKTFLGGRTAC